MVFSPKWCSMKKYSSKWCENYSYFLCFLCYLEQKEVRSQTCSLDNVFQTNEPISIQVLQCVFSTLVLKINIPVPKYFTTLIDGGFDNVGTLMKYHYIFFFHLNKT